MNEGYVKSLDGVRAIAIILVMTFHFGLNDFGWAGVQLFFVLSGFLITGILWKEKFNAGPLPFKFKKFWIRRSLRIFPLYYGYLLVLGIAYLLFHFPSYYLDYIGYLLSYTFNYTRLMPQWHVTPLFTHLWSLAVEEQFYLLFPIFVFLCPARWIKIIMIAVILWAPCTRYMLGQYYSARTSSSFVAGDAVYWNTLSQLDAFCTGGMIPVFALGNKIRKPYLMLLFFLVLTITAGLVNHLAIHSGNSYWADLGFGNAEMKNLQHVWSYSLLNFLFASFILVLVSGTANRPIAQVRRLLETGWMVRIGKVSYGMYLFHFLILVYGFKVVFEGIGPLWKLAMFVPYLFTVYLVAALSFRYYEMYFIRLKDRIPLAGNPVGGVTRPKKNQ